MNIFVANLNFKLRGKELRELFENFGEVVSAKVIMDRNTGKSRGFGFVEMADEDEGSSAIENLDGTEFSGRNIVVKKAKPRNEESQE